MMGDMIDPTPDNIDLSIIAPFYNEEGNVVRFLESVFKVAWGLGRRFEVIAVNDGSKDGTLELLRTAVSSYPELRVVDLRRNYGQTAAMMAGIDAARGQTILTIDADLQNDPEDIPMLLEELKRADVVSGWRKDRQDHAIRRNLVSRIANRIISWVSGVKLRDYGCSLKAYRREVLDGVRLYGEMHRFIPIYASWMGAKVIEVPVRHHPRVAGQSKYGLERIFKVTLDLIVVKFLDRYLVKPIYVFGAFGAFCFSIGMLAFLYMVYLKVVDQVSMISTPLPVFVAMCIMMGFMAVLMGLLAEVLMRTYFESSQRSAYSIRRIYSEMDSACAE